MFKLVAGIVGGELPVGFGVMAVPIGLPGGDFGGEGLDVLNTPVQALR